MLVHVAYTHGLPCLGLTHFAMCYSTSATTSTHWWAGGPVEGVIGLCLVLRGTLLCRLALDMLVVPCQQAAAAASSIGVRLCRSSFRRCQLSCRERLAGRRLCRCSRQHRWGSRGHPGGTMQAVDSAALLLVNFQW